MLSSFLCFFKSPFKQSLGAPGEVLVQSTSTGSLGGSDSSLLHFDFINSELVYSFCRENLVTYMVFNTVLPNEMSFDASIWLYPTAIGFDSGIVNDANPAICKFGEPRRELAESNFRVLGSVQQQELNGAGSSVLRNSAPSEHTQSMFEYP